MYELMISTYLKNWICVIFSFVLFNKNMDLEMYHTRLFENKNNYSSQSTFVKQLGYKIF